MDIKLAEPGQKVIYTPRKGCSEAEKEAGVITRVGREYIYVRYDRSSISKATRPENLELMKIKEREV